MRIKALLMIVALASMAVIVMAATEGDIRVNGASGAYVSIDIDTADTASDGTLALFDTFYSDTFDISDYKYCNIAIRYASVDTGGALGDDTTMDTFVVSAITSFGGSDWTVYADTFVNVGDSARHHFWVDTLAYTNLFFKTIYWDTLNPAVDDENVHTFDIDLLAGGTR